MAGLLLCILNSFGRVCLCTCVLFLLWPFSYGLMQAIFAHFKREARSGVRTGSFLHRYIADVVLGDHSPEPFPSVTVRATCHRKGPSWKCHWIPVVTHKKCIDENKRIIRGAVSFGKPAGEGAKSRTQHLPK